jgi:hypothetical protein
LKDIFDKQNIGSFTKAKCLEGEYNYKGSCYYISNLKYWFGGEIINALKQKTDKELHRRISFYKNGGFFENKNHGGEETWDRAQQECSKRNKMYNSSLLYFDDETYEEYVHILNLLKPNKTNEENKFFFGLVYNYKGLFFFWKL